LSPAHMLTLVHAVQQPLRLEAMASVGSLGIVRFKKDTSVFFSGKFRIHAPSTSKFDLVASWKAPEEEATEEEATEEEARQRGWKTHVLEIPVHAQERPSVAADGNVPIAIYDDDVLQFKAPPATADEAARAKYPARQDFGDTKHRRVTYKLI